MAEFKIGRLKINFSDARPEAEERRKQQELFEQLLARYGNDSGVKFAYTNYKLMGGRALFGNPKQELIDRLNELHAAEQRGEYDPGQSRRYQPRAERIQYKPSVTRGGLQEDEPMATLGLHPTRAFEGLTSEQSRQVAETNFRLRARFSHPDTGGNSEWFKRVRDAYNVVKSRIDKPDRRK